MYTHTHCEVRFQRLSRAMSRLPRCGPCTNAADEASRVYLYIHLSIYLSIFLSIYLSLSLSPLYDLYYYIYIYIYTHCIVISICI